jgi:hypothetical protein
MPSVAPTMRAVLTRPKAVPERAGGGLATATALTGPSPTVKGEARRSVERYIEIVRGDGVAELR